jgi:hypothetical protein
MDLWAALLSAMRTWRARQINRRTVDRLIAGGSPGLDEHRGLGVLLEAARSPATPGELAGERAAVEGFTAARRTAPARPRGKNRVPVPPSVRRIAMTVAAAVAILTVGGTALAARTGNLPEPAQRRAHAIFASLGVPAPAPEPAATPTPTPAPHPTTSTPRTRPTPTPARPSTATVAPGVPALTDLCRRWQDDTTPHNVTGQDRKALRQAAGGEKNIDGYCAALLTPAPAGEPASTPPSTGKPGNGHTKKPSHGNPHPK